MLNVELNCKSVFCVDDISCSSHRLRGSRSRQSCLEINFLILKINKLHFCKNETQKSAFQSA